MLLSTNSPQATEPGVKMKTVVYGTPKAPSMALPVEISIFFFPPQIGQAEPMGKAAVGMH